MGLARRGFLKGLASVPFIGILAQNHMDDPEPMLINREPEPDLDWDGPLDWGIMTEGSGFICCTGTFDRYEGGNSSGFITACSG